MENKIKKTERWVEEQMALLTAPHGWEPNASIARTRLEGRLSAQRPTLVRTWLPRTAIIVLAFIVLMFAIPKTRALTQQLWQWLTVRKAEIVQADFDRLRGSWLIPRHVIAEELPSGVEPSRPEHLDFNEAVRRAGFVPRLPHEGVPSGVPIFTTIGPGVWSTTLKVADLELSLSEAGVDDQPIPKEWDGAQLSMQLGSAIIAAWDNMTLIQHPPLIFSAPADFDFSLYWTAALRAAGIKRDEAKQLAERITTTPTLLLGIQAGSNVRIHEVNLSMGPATLVEFKIGRDERVSLWWNVADRVYMLDANSEEQAIAAANSIHSDQDEPVVIAESAAGDEFPIGSYEMFVEKDKSILTFTPDGRIVGKRVKGGQAIEGRYATNADEIVVKEMKENRGATEEGCAGEGKYKWSFDGRALRFVKIADSCEGRAMTLTAKPLALVKADK